MVIQLICRNSVANLNLLRKFGWNIYGMPSEYVKLHIDTKQGSSVWSYRPYEHLLVYPQQLAELLLMPTEDSLKIYAQELIDEYIRECDKHRLSKESTSDR